MKKTIIAILAILLLACLIACNGDVDLKLFGKTVTPKYTGLDAWQAAGCAEPVVTYKGTDSTTYAESTTAPTAKGSYIAVFKLDSQSVDAIEVPFEL